MLNISVSFQPIDMLLGYIWRGNWGAQKTSPYRLVLLWSFVLNFQKTGLLVQSFLEHSTGIPVLCPSLFQSWSSLFPVLRPDFQTLVPTPSVLPPLFSYFITVGQWIDKWVKCTIERQKGVSGEVQIQCSCGRQVIEIHESFKFWSIFRTYYSQISITMVHICVFYQIWNKTMEGP